MPSGRLYALPVEVTTSSPAGVEVLILGTHAWRWSRAELGGWVSSRDQIEGFHVVWLHHCKIPAVEGCNSGDVSALSYSHD